MIIDYDRRPNATEDEKLQSLVENIQLALNSIDAGTLTGNITNNVSINAGTLNGTIDGDYLFVKNLDADSITAVKGWIDKLLVQTHLLANEGEVFELDAIQVNASRIKTGTLDVERLIYTNQTTGEKYLVHFDPDGSTTYEKLDGNVIEDLTITADKIVSESIMARHITTQNIEGTGGWINLRNGTFFYGNGATYAAANNAISWDGSKLKIKADDFELSSGKSIFEEIEAIETWFYAVAPTTSNEPAKNWNTEKLKELHLRDIYFDTTSGKSYRWAKDGTTYKWVEIEDVELAAVTRRLSDAETSITKNADSIVSLASANETYVKPDGATATNKLRTQIKQNADAISLKANSTDVYTKAEADAAITVSAQGIEQRVSSTYQTKSDMSNYPTTTQMNSAISQSAGEITASVSSTYETKNDATSKLNTAKGYTDSEITTAKAAIKVTTDEISTEVSKKVGSSEVISKINQSAETVKIQASKVEIDGTATFIAIKDEVENTANTAVDNIEIGGRNLARGTADMIKGNGAWSTGTWRDSGASNTYNYTVSDSPVASVSKGVLVTTKVANTRYGVCQDNCPMLSKKITFSVWAKGTAGGTITLQSVWWSNIPSSTHNGKTVTATGEWQYITFTADLTNATVPNGKCSICYLYWKGDNVNDTCVFVAPKLEYGTKATAWSPAPEDIESEVSSTKASLTLTNNSITSLVEGNTTYTKPDGTTAASAIGTAIKQTQDNVLIKATKNDTTNAAAGKKLIESFINVNPETVKISAKNVEIDGTAVFNAISSDVDDAITDKGYQTSSQVESAITSKGYQTASQVSTAVSNGVSGKADKTEAVGRTQRIYYRKTSNGAPSKNTTWLSTSGTGYGNWSLKIPQLTSGTTKYPYLYTAVQTQTVSQMSGTTCSCSDVLLDDTATIIDGGTIITGTVNANAVNASSGTFDVANIPNLNASKITAGDIAADRMKANSITAINSLTTGKINAERLDVGSITVDSLKDGQELIDNTVKSSDYKEGSIVSWSNMLIDKLVADIEPIQSLNGYDAPWVGGAGKNKLENTASTTTTNGITFTVNSDGTVTANGTATADAQLPIVLDTSKLNGDLYFVGSNGATESVANAYMWDQTTGARCKKWDGTSASATSFNGTLQQVKVVQGNNVRLTLRVMNGKTVSNHKFIPMIVASSVSDATYEPYSNICPISGRTEADTHRTGKNLAQFRSIDKTKLGIAWKSDGSSIRVIGTATSESDPFNSSDVTNYQTMLNGEYPAGTYTLSCRGWTPSNTNDRLIAHAKYADGSKVVGVYGTRISPTTIGGQPNDKTFTATAPFKLDFWASITSGSTVDFTATIQLELGSTATDYEPYQGDTYTTALGRTVYGGTLDVVSGVLTVTHGMVDMGSLNWAKLTDVNVFYADIQGGPLAVNGGNDGLCSIYPIFKGQYSALTDKAVTIANSTFSSAQGRTAVKDTSYSSASASAFKTAVTGQQLVYELATPQTYQLTPRQVSALVGENNLWTNSGTVHVTLTGVKDDTEAIANAAKTATTYITDIGNDGIRVHDSHTTNNSVVINSNGMEIFKGGTDAAHSVAKYGDTVRIGKSGQQRVEVTSSAVEIHDADGDLRLKTTDEGLELYGGTDSSHPVSTFRADGAYMGNGQEWGIYLTGTEYSSGMNLLQHDTGGGIHTGSVVLRREGNLGITADGGDINLTVAAGHAVNVSADGLIINEHTTGIGSVLSATASKAITTAGIDTYTQGASIKIPIGTWVITGSWPFNTGSSSGARNLGVVLSTSSGNANTGILARQRVYAHNNAYAQLQVVYVGEFEEETTVYVKGASSMTYTSAASTEIRAVRIA